MKYFKVITILAVFSITCISTAYAAVVPVPEPTSIILLGLGLAGIIFFGKNSKK